MDARHEIAQRIVDQPMLLDEAQAGKRRGPHSHLEVIAFSGGVTHRDRGARQRRRQAAFQLVDSHHPAWLAPVRSWRKAHAAPATHLGAQLSEGRIVLSQVHV